MEDVQKTDSYMRNLSTFLNNIPDYSKEQKQEENIPKDGELSEDGKQIWSERVQRWINV